MRSAKEDEACKDKPAIDLVSAVEEFHKLSFQDLSKLIREAENGTIRFTKQDGSLLEINLESLAKYLTLHLIAKLLSFKRDEQHLRYLLAGLRLLHGLYDLASRHSVLDQVLVEDVTSFERIIDLIFFTIIFISNFRQIQKPDDPNNMTLLPSALLASSFYLLTTSISSQWHDITSILLVHPKVDVFTSVSFPAVRVVINFLKVKLPAQHTDIKSNADEVNRLCLHCEASLQFLHSLCQQKDFRERLIKNKELCKEGSVLWLVQDIMKLPQCEDSHVMAVVSRLKSKILSIMLQLCEVESVPFLDLVASTTEGLDLAKNTVFEILELLRIMFCGDVNGNPRGILELTAMRITEILCDDSNFRSYIVSNFTEVLTRVFLVGHGEFLSSWCSSDSEPAEEDVTLNYDSFSQAGQVLGVMSASRASKSTFSTSRTPFAHQKTSLLVKIVANLTCFVPDLCKEEKGLFLNKFQWCLQKEITNSPDGGAERVAVATRNLNSLLVHAGSLTPRYLNEDDVNLLRLFITQLEKLITPQEADYLRVKDVHSRGQSSSPGPEGFKISGEGSGARGVDESERDGDNIERIGSDLSNMQLKNDAGEEENVEKQQQLKRRKRNIMNDVQIGMIEKALEDEPRMQRTSASLQFWAENLSLHGSEITHNQLKNWLNNRKAKLARAAAKSGGIGGDDGKQGGESAMDVVEISDSPDNDSPADDPSSYGSVLRICKNESSETVSVRTTTSFRRQNGQNVVLVGGKGEEIGKGSIHLAKGIWFGNNLEELGLCVVDVTHLAVDESTQLPHPCDATGTTFAEAQIILLRKRILWESSKLLLIQH